MVLDATRSIVNGKYNAHIDPIFRKLKILKFLKIKDIVDQGRENIMFAINNKEAPIGTQKLFKKADPSNRLRQNHLNFEASFTQDVDSCTKNVLQHRCFLITIKIDKIYDVDQWEHGLMKTPVLG